MIPHKLLFRFGIADRARRHVIWLTACQSFGRRARNKATLKITINETETTATMKLEGRVAGPWVREFESAWNSLSPKLASRRLAIDLCNVTYMDLGGRELLAEIHYRTGAELFATTPLMKHFIEKVSRSKNDTGGKGQ